MSFRMISIAKNNDPLDEKFTTVDPQDEFDWLARSNVYIPKTQVVRVEKFDNQMVHCKHGKTLRGMDWDNMCEENMRIGNYWFELFCISFPASDCRCGLAAYVQHLYKSSGSVLPPSLRYCACELTSIFPLYEVTVRNYVEVSENTDYTTKMESHARVRLTPTVTYLLHPDEREHMERYLAGRDNPIMHDFVELLKYAPPVGPAAGILSAGGVEYQAAQARDAKKRKTTT